MHKLLLLFVLLFNSVAFAQVNFCTDELNSVPVQAGGREKPLYVLAHETIKFMTGKDKLEGMSSTVAFCKLTLSAFGMPLSFEVPIKVEHIDAKKLLGLNENDDHIGVNTLNSKINDLESELSTLKENNSYKKELTKIRSRLMTYRAIVEARAWSVPVEKDGKIDFVDLAQYLTETRVKEASEKTDTPVNYLIHQAQQKYQELKGTAYLLELKYYKWNLFTWAMIISILAMGLLIGLKNKIPGLVLTIISIAMQITSMAMRVMISGRAPVTNMYETVMFSGLGALVLALIITTYRKEFAFVIAGLAYNVLSLMMMRFAEGMLDEGISPLVPVLRDNFWLSTHVTTIILSYAALALSWILANAILIRSSFFNVSKEEYRYQVDLIYSAIKYGIILLAAGIILGGVWADYSWGRFWGWDPKETWSLIVLLVYMAILHGKYTNWVSPKIFVLTTAGAFMSVMMAWFGVNYILASGLHSYGFSEGGAIFLGTFFLIQTVLLIICGIKKQKA